MNPKKNKGGRPRTRYKHEAIGNACEEWLRLRGIGLPTGKQERRQWFKRRVTQE